LPGSRSRRRRVVLRVIAGKDRGVSFDVSHPDVYRIGREQGEVPLSDRLCSTRHAQIEVLGHGECFLEDLGSRNGTFWNGRRISRVRLEDGDEMRVGNSRLRLSIVDADGDAPGP
jgi:pSer/pThr/pTyr-binding forkhead associated (FHA) protein